MTNLKHRQPNYRYLHKKEKNTLKQGAIILLTISLIGGYVQSRTPANQLRSQVVYAEDDSHNLSQPEPTDNLSITNQAGEANQVKEEVGTVSVVVPTPTPTTPPSPTTERQMIEKYIREVFGEHADEAFTLLECENENLDPLAVNEWNSNGTTDHSVMQINSIHLSGKEFSSCVGADTDWRANIECGKDIFDKYGWSAWTCSYTLGITPFYDKKRESQGL